MKYAGTLFLSVLMVGAYFVFSSGFFIPDEVLGVLSFSVSNPAGIFSYSFLHISLQHLLGNLFLLIPLGLVIEPALSRRDFFAVYFISGIVAAAAFAALVPNVVLVGASAAVAGLVIPACLISVRRTVLNIVIFTLLAVGLIWGVNQAVAFSQKSAEVQAGVLTQNITVLAEEKNETARQAAAVEEKYVRGEVTQEAYEQAKQNISQKLGFIENRTKELSAELNKTKAFVGSIERGKQRERESQTSMFVHLLGSLSGFAYVTAFRRDVLLNSGRQFYSFVVWLEKHRRIKWRKRRK